MVGPGYGVIAIYNKVFDIVFISYNTKHSKAFVVCFQHVIIFFIFPYYMGGIDQCGQMKWAAGTKKKFD